MYSCDEFFSNHDGVTLVFDKYQNNTREPVRHEITCIFLFLTRHNNP